MELEKARAIADEIVTWLEPACTRIAVAGSIRREKPEVGDIEIVHIPLIGEVQIGLFSEMTEPVNEMERALYGLMNLRQLARDEGTPRWGTRYKRLVHCASGMGVDLFAALPETWGYILALRTGPADWNKLLVSPPYYGGICPLNVRMDNGWIRRNGEPVATPDEASFFEVLGLPYIPPADRLAERLKEYQGVGL